MQLSFVDHAPPRSLPDDELLALWVEKMSGATRINTVVAAFPQHQQRAVAMATSLVGGLKAWRELSGVELYAKDIKQRFMAHYRREQNNG